jgi:hypothetical protein
MSMENKQAAKKATKRQKDAAVANLYRAVQKYVEVNGGKLAVIGGIKIIEWPGDSSYNFTVGVGCTGRRPQKD